MFSAAAILLVVFVSMLAVFLLCALGEAIEKWFNTPSDRKERKFLSEHLRGDWR